MNSRHWLRWSAKFVMISAAGGGAFVLAAATLLSPTPEQASPGVSVEAQVVAGPESADVSVTLKPLGLLGPLDRLKYAIRTHYNSGGGCAGERVRTALIGEPTAVDMGGSFLPDATVTLVAVPGFGGSPDVLQLAVSKTAIGTLRGRVEVIVAPDAAAPERVAFGYDACDTGAPLNFSANISATDSRISMRANTTAPTAALTIIGSAFKDVGGVATDPTALAARMAPVPSTVSAVVEIVGPSSYKATVNTSRPSNMRLGYSDIKGASRMNAVATIETFPGRLDLTFNATEIGYTASAPVDHVGLSLESYKPAEAGDPPARTNQLTVDLRGVPTNARLLRTSPTHITFTTPGTIASTTVGFTSFESGVTLPMLERLDGQYLVAAVTPRYSQAEVRILGLSHADVDAGDPVVVDVTHAAGPFRVAVRVTGTDAAQPTVDVTRDLAVHVLDLPATAKVTYSPTTQAFTYDGSAVIEELRADVVSNVVFVDDATTSHLLLRGVPTGLTGRLDTPGKTFTATLTGGSLSLLEAQVTSGPDLRLPDGVQGVALEDHPGSYAAFFRILGLQHVNVGWSETHQFAEVDHTAGPFHLLVDTDDTDTKDIEVDGRLLDLPAQARFDHRPSKPINCPRQPCGETPLLITFATDDPTATIAQLTLDVVSAEPLVGNATIVHLIASELPPLSITVDATGERFLAETTRGTLGSIGAELCSTTGCGLVATSGADGVFLVDLESGVYDAVVRLNGLRRAEVAWGTPVLVDVHHDAGPFDVFVEQDYQVAVPNDPNPQPPPPCDLPKPRDCEVIDDDEPPPPDTHPVTFRRSLHVEARDLPATVHLTYDPDTQHVTYVGSSEIGSLEAHYTDGRALVGRARFAHLVAEGIPTGLNLVFAFSDTGDVLTADTGDGTLGHLELELLSSTDLLGAVNQSPGFRDGFDGLVYWDLSDFEGSGVEPIDDAFAIAVRVTGLQRFDYRRGPYSDGVFDHNRVSVDIRRSGGPSLWVEIQKADQSRSPREIPGLGTYRAELLNLDYANPPDHLGFEFDELKRGVHTLYHLRYHGSSSGEQARFVSNVGSGGDFGPMIDFTATPVPGGGDSLANPGVFACIAPNSMRCSDTNDPDFQSDQLSVSLLVTEPMLINGIYSGGDSKVLVNDVVVETGIVASTETNNDGTFGLKSTLIYVDTRYATVTGSIRIVKENSISETDDTHVHVVMPEGFMALGRQVEMEYEGTGPRSFGRVVCPAGTLLTSDSIGIDFNLERRFCPAARVDSVESGGVVTPVLEPSTHELVVTGTNFVPWLGGNAGTRFYVVSDQPLPNAPPLAGALEADTVEWIDISTIRVTITIPEAWETGPHTVAAVNPVETQPGYCVDCVVLVGP